MPEATNLTTRTEVSTFWIQGPYHMGGGAPGRGACNHIYMHRESGSDAEVDPIAKWSRSKV